jgi:hypothetical protein
VDVDGNKTTARATQTSQRPPPVAEASEAAKRDHEKTVQTAARPETKIRPKKDLVAKEPAAESSKQEKSVTAKESRPKTTQVEKPARVAQVTATRDNKGIYTLSSSSGGKAKAPAEMKAEKPPTEQKTQQTPATPSAE